MSTTEESRVRRQLAREGLRLEKVRGHRAEHGGYLVTDAESRAVVGGGTPVPYSLTLDEAAGYVDWWRQGERAS